MGLFDKPQPKPTIGDAVDLVSEGQNPFAPIGVKGDQWGMQTSDSMNRRIHGGQELDIFGRPKK